MNITELNSSTMVNTSSVMEWYQCKRLPFYLFILSEVINTWLGFSTNLWVLVLILRNWKSQAEQEIFTLNLAVLEILYCLFSQVLLINYIWLEISIIYKYSFFAFGLNYFGRSLFQCGISIERFIAVVHPVFFFKHSFFKFKVVFLIVAWIITLVLDVYNVVSPNFISFCLVIAIPELVNLYCGFSIFRVLRRPSPGAGGKKVEEMNMLKKRASQTVLFIQAVVLYNYIPIFLAPFIIRHIEFETYICTVMPLAFSCSLLGSFVHSLVFLQRAGNLCCMSGKNTLNK